MGTFENHSVLGSVKKQAFMFLVLLSQDPYLYLFVSLHVLLCFLPSVLTLLLVPLIRCLVSPSHTSPPLPSFSLFLYKHK